MPELVADCPRCNAKKHTFLIKAFLPMYTEYQWKNHFEAYCVCKNCIRGTIFHLSQKNYDDKEIFSDWKNLHQYAGSINQIMDVEGYINTRNISAPSAPDYTPEAIKKIFDEGAQSVVGNCPNAAAAMFRLCIDLSTKNLLPHENIDGLNNDIRKKLWDRMNWLFETKRLDESLKDLADCIRLDGNDGAHDGTIKKEDAEDLLDLTKILLERLFTEPCRLEEAKARRVARRDK
jgi:hypothetical protein